MKPIRLTGILLVLILSNLIAVGIPAGIGPLYKQLLRDTESVFVTNPRALVPMWVGQLFLLFSLFIRSNLYIKSGLVAIGLGSVFFLDDVYKSLTTLQILVYILFAISSIALFWWAWNADKR